MPYIPGRKIPSLSFIHSTNSQCVDSVPGIVISTQVTEVGDMVFGLTLGKRIAHSLQVFSAMEDIYAGCVGVRKFREGFLEVVLPELNFEGWRQEFQKQRTNDTGLKNKQHVLST